MPRPRHFIKKTILDKRSRSRPERQPAPAGGARTRVSCKTPPPKPKTTGLWPSPDMPGVEWLYGKHAVAHALQNPRRRIRALLLTPETAQDPLFTCNVTSNFSQPPTVLTVEKKDLHTYVPINAIHQGVVAAVDPLPIQHIEDLEKSLPPTHLPSDKRLYIVLDHVADPQNMGAIFRSAAAFGAHAVLVHQRNAASLTSTVAKIASGGLERVAYVEVTNIARSLAFLKSEGFWVIGLDETGQPMHQQWSLEQQKTSQEKPRRIVLVLGSEGSGLRRLTAEACDLLVCIPTSPSFPTLNVAHACTLALYEITRQWDDDKDSQAPRQPKEPQP